MCKDKKTIIVDKTIKDTNYFVNKDEQIKFINCTFEFNTLRMVFINGISFIDCKFINCEMYNIRLFKCKFEDVVFENCELIGIDFANAVSRIDDTSIWQGIVVKGLLTFRNSSLKFCKLPLDYQDQYVYENCKYGPKVEVNEKPFYGYKYTKNHLIILEIPADALVIYTTTDKHRCNRAKVVSILNRNGTYSGTTIDRSWYKDSFIYATGKDVNDSRISVDFNDDCKPGIHFFLNVKDGYKFYTDIIKSIQEY